MLLWELACLRKTRWLSDFPYPHANARQLWSIKKPTVDPDPLNYNWVLHREANVMRELTFEQKQDHYESVRRSNYLASLRLEGFDTTRADADKSLPSREAALRKYLKSPS